MTVSIVLDRIGHGVITQTGALIQFQNVDAAAPRTIAHPQLTIIVIEHTWIDGMGKVISPVVVVVTAWKGAFCADHELQVGFLPIDAGICGVAEAGIYHRTLIDVWTGDGAGSQENDRGIPCRTIQTQILAPLFHLLVVDDIGSPHIAPYRPCITCFWIRKGAMPRHRIKRTEIHFLNRAVHQSIHLRGLVRDESLVGRSGNNRTTGIHHSKDIVVHARPRLKVGCARHTHMASKDVIIFG